MDLDLSSCGLTQKRLDQLCPTLTNLAYLRRLSLRNNPIGPWGVVNLVKSLVLMMEAAPPPPPAAGEAATARSAKDTSRPGTRGSMRSRGSSRAGRTWETLPEPEPKPLNVSLLRELDLTNVEVR